MKILAFSSLFFLPFGSFANDRHIEIEYKAINLVIQKYGKGLKN